MSRTIDCVWPLQAALGEGPLWSADEGCLWFVDIKQCQIHRFAPATGAAQSFPAPSAPGFIVPHSGGGFIVGLKTGLHRFYPERGGFELLATLEDPGLDNRLNDAHVDARGRLWFGSMHDGEARETGALYRLDEHGIQRLDAGYVITNGPAVCPAGRHFYHVDSVRRLIYVFDLDAAGSLHDKRVLIEIEPAGGHPDGVCVDAQGCLWVALYGGWALRRYSPGGEWLDTIKVPCAQVTKGALGGADRCTLYITTARQNLGPVELEEQPLAGGLFAIRVDTPGLQQYAVNPLRTLTQRGAL